MDDKEKCMNCNTKHNPDDMIETRTGCWGSEYICLECATRELYRKTFGPTVREED